MSDAQIRLAPAPMAVSYSVTSVSGSARVVSSVTNMTGRPFFTARLTDSSTCLRITSTDQLSTTRRIELDPMNAHVSIATPDSTAARIAPWISVGCVRTATFGVILSFAVSFASATTVASACGDAPGSPMSALEIPSWSIR